MKTIQEIEESKINKNMAARVTRQQEIEGDTDDKEYSTHDENMGSESHILKEAGVNNSDIE